MAPSRRRTGSSRRTVRRNSSAWSGSTSYSSVTSTGPSSPSSWEAVSGSDQRGSGRRSRFERPCNAERRARKRDDGGHGGEDGRAREDETVAGEALADAWQEGRAHDRARAEAPEEEPVARRRELESPAREERE